MSFLSKIIFAALLCFSANATCHSPAPIPEEAQEVLHFWFGHIESPADYPENKASLWFNGGDHVDEEIRNRFEYLVEAAERNELDLWKETAKGRLALIILVDQFPRNIYRGLSRAFAFDCIAEQLTLEGLANGDDLDLLPIERVFFYLPLEHAENLDLQKLSTEKFHAIIPTASSEHISHFISFEDYAWRHYDIIAKFGRFPHRNKTMGRESTPEELEFLKNPNSSF